MKSKTSIIVSLVAAFFFFSLFSPLTQSVRAVLDTREREVNPNQELDTFVFVTGSSPELWEIALPGDAANPVTYYVTLACGDARWPVGPHLVKLSGNGGSTWNTVVAGNWDDATVPNEFIPVINESVEVTAEKLSLELGGNDATNILNFIIISDSIETPPTTFPAYINFQPPAVPTPASYDMDDGSVYDSGRGYGWDVQLDSRDRDEHSDQRLDTFVFNSDVATWNLDVPIGTYYVTLSVGDARWPVGPHRVKVEGITVVNDKDTVPQGFASVTNHIVNVYDGQLTVEIGGAGGTTMLNYIDVFDDRSDVTFSYPLRINFQPGGAELVANYSPDKGALYKAIYGYGWNILLDCRERGLQPNQLLDTTIYEPGTTLATWEYTLPSGSPAGNYYVYVSCGDSEWPTGPHYLTMEGVTIFDGTVATGINEYLQVVNQQVYIGDSVANLTMGGSGYNTHLNYVIIDNVTQIIWGSTININFQPGWADPYSDYIIDTGEEYDIVRRYGWDIGLDSRDRDNPSAPDQRYDTITYTPTGQTANWQIDVDNGDYLVTMEFGDPDWETGPYYVVLEGNEVLNGETTGANSYLLVDNEPITVTDGKIDLQMGHVSGPNHICYISIVEN